MKNKVKLEYQRYVNSFMLDGVHFVGQIIVNDNYDKPIFVSLNEDESFSYFKTEDINDKLWGLSPIYDDMLINKFNELISMKK